MSSTILTTNTDCMPQSLRNLASNKGFQVESDCINYSEDQGLPSTATVCVERVLMWSDGGIRLHVRVLRRETLDGLWHSLCDTPYSDTLTHAEAVALINHWGDLQQEARARFVKLDQQPAPNYIVFFDVEAYRTKEEFDRFDFLRQKEGFFTLESATEHANSAAYADYYQVMVMTEGDCVYSRFVREEKSEPVVQS